MKRFYKYLIVIVLACSTFGLKAQSDMVFSLMPQLPYTNYFNPGIRMPYNGMFGLALSNINFSVYNSSLNADNIYSFNSQGVEVIDGAKFVNSLKEQDNYLSANFSVDLFNVGFRVKKFFFNLDWRMRFDSEFQYSKDFIGFFVMGNGHYLGADNPCDFNVGIDLTAFTEFGVGVQYDVNEHLTVGVRPKILSGIANITVNNDQTKIYTDANTYAISADVNLDIKAATIFNTDISRIGDIDKLFDSENTNEILDIKENMGLGVDFGASYIFNKHWGVAAGVYDLGYIKWRDSKVKKNSSQNVELNSGIFDEIGDVTNFKLDYSFMLDKIVDEVWGNDSLMVGDDYKTSLKTRLLLQGYYEFNPMVRLTAIGQMYSTRGTMKPAFTLAYSGEFFDFLNASLSYTLSEYTGTALGVGLGIHAGPVNCYFVADNILALTKINASPLEFATAYQTSAIRFGIAFTIGKYQRLSDRVTSEESVEQEN